MSKNDEMDFAATLPAVELARLHRRLAFLQAAVIQLMRDGRGLKEWFSAAEIAALGLPGLPVTRAGIARIAREQKWEARRPEDGGARLYHFSTLPRLAFGAFVERVVRGGDAPARDDEASEATPSPAADKVRLPALAGPGATVAPPAANTTPAWALPLLRLLRAGGGPLEHALAELPRHLAAGAPCPSVDEAREVLARVGVSVL
jgi:hypothetical protein